MGAGRRGKKKAAESGEGDGGVRKRLFMRGRKKQGGRSWRRRLEKEASGGGGDAGGGVGKDNGWRRGGGE